MGGNGTASVNGMIPVENREYISLGTYSDPVFGDIEIIEWKGKTNKTPEESNSAPKIYVTFDKKGNGVNEIAFYGKNHKKEGSVHTVPHNNKDVNGPHYHKWSNGSPVGKPKLLSNTDPKYLLTQRLLKLKFTK